MEVRMTGFQGGNRMVRFRQNSKAFSLFELMLVMSIIALLMAIAAPAWWGNRSMETDGSVREMAAFFDEARAMAKAYGEPVRILIHNDPGEPNAYLRRFQVVRKTEDKENPEKFDWEPVLQPFHLPDGMYFDKTRPGVATETMEFPGIGGDNLTWLYYEIGGSGAPSSEKIRNVVIAPGIYEPGMPLPLFPNPKLASGFRISDTARFLFFQTEEDIVESFPE